MTNIQRRLFFEKALALFFFILPFQTGWIVKTSFIGSPSGVWEYGTIAFTLFDAASVLVAGLFLFLYKKEVCSFFTTFSFFKLTAVLFLGIVFFSGIVWAPHKDVALFWSARMVQALALCWIIRVVRPRTRVIALALVCAGLIHAGLAIEQFLNQRVFAFVPLGIAAHQASDLGASVVGSAEFRWLRAYGGFPHPNVAGIFFTVSYLCSLFLGVSAKTKKRVVAYLLCSSLLLAALFFSFSRSAWLACVGVLIGVGIASFVMRRNRRGGSEEEREENSNSFRIKPVWLFILSNTLVLLVLGFLFFEPLAVRFGITESRLEKQSSGERIESVRSFFHSRSPLSFFEGTGVGNSTWVAFQRDKEQGEAKPFFSYQPLHSLPFLIAHELGLAGCIAFLGLLFFFLRDSLRFHLWSWVVAGMIAASFFDHFFWTLPFGLLFFWTLLALASSKNSSS